MRICNIEDVSKIIIRGRETGHTIPISIDFFAFVPPASQPVELV